LRQGEGETGRRRTTKRNTIKKINERKNKKGERKEITSHKER
jgi:hypothetical protein